jgi:hypothetical protein
MSNNLIKDSRPKSWDDPDHMDRQVLVYEYKLLKEKYEAMKKMQATFEDRYKKLYYFAAYEVQGGDRFDGWHSTGGKIAWRLPNDKNAEEAEEFYNACEE